MLIPRLSFGKLVHVSSILMTLLLAMNMHALAGHLKDDGVEAGAPAGQAAPLQMAAASTSDTMASTYSAARNAAEGWTSVLSSDGNGRAIAPAAPAPDRMSAKKTGMSDADCPRGIACAGAGTVATGRSGESDPGVDRAETDLVKDILARRSDIDSEQKDLEAQRHILDAARSALDAKMRDLDTSMAALAEKQEAHRETMSAETDRLVKIYEDMPPKEAAAVFDIMDIHVLVSVANRMTPRKISAVMGYMMPERVNLVSQYMAGVRSFRSSRLPFGGDGRSGPAATDMGAPSWWLKSPSGQGPADQDPLKLSRQ